MNKIIVGSLMLFSVMIPQQVMAEMVGALMPNKKIPHFMIMHKSLIKELGVLGIDAEVILQKPSPSEMAWKNATRKLVILGSEVIVAYGSATALAITGENNDVPVVYNCLCDPTKQGVEGKVTGTIGRVSIEDLLVNLKKISNFKKLAILYSHEEEMSKMQVEQATAAAEAGGASVVKLETHDTEEYVFDGADAVFITSSANLNSEGALAKIVAATKAKKIATASAMSGSCEHGVLISLAPDPEQQGKVAAKMVAEILDGADPTDIPPDTNPKVEMTINLTTAKELGLSIPFDLLGKAKVVK
jgi:putative ABC transport system substrate-binding protein